MIDKIKNWLKNAIDKIQDILLKIEIWLFGGDE